MKFLGKIGAVVALVAALAVGAIVVHKYYEWRVIPNYEAAIGQEERVPEEIVVERTVVKYKDKVVYKTVYVPPEGSVSVEVGKLAKLRGEVDQLQKEREQIEKDKELSDEERQRLLAEKDEELARLKAKMGETIKVKDTGFTLWLEGGYLGGARWGEDGLMWKHQPAVGLEFFYARRYNIGVGWGVPDTAYGRLGYRLDFIPLVHGSKATVWGGFDFDADSPAFGIGFILDI